MGYGNRCPTCLRPLQTGRGIGSTFTSIAKRAMARELEKKMALATLAVQRYGRQQQQQKGSGLIKTIASSKPVRTVGNAIVEALANRAIEAIAPPKKRTVNTQRRRTTRTVTNPRKKRKAVSQTGSGLPLLSLMAAAAPLMGKSVGLGALGALVNHGVQKALGG